MLKAMSNKKEALLKEISSLDAIVRTIQLRITGTDITSEIQRSFFGEYKRLLELVANDDSLNDEKAEKMLSLVKELKLLGRKSKEFSETEKEQFEKINQEVIASIDRMTAINYGIWAPTYNDLFYRSEIYSCEFETKRILSFIEHSLDTSKPFHLLDIGSGTGFPALMLARLYPHAKVYAFDNSEMMLEVAKKLERKGKWKTSENSLTAIMQRTLNSHDAGKNEGQPITFVHSPYVTLEPGSIDISLMATAIPSYTPYTEKLVKSIYEALRPGGKAMINFSYMSLSRFILLWRDFGFKKAREEYKKEAITDIIIEPTQEGKQIFSFKISFSGKACEMILRNAGFKIVRVHSMFPLHYLMLSLGRKAMRKDNKQIRAPYMYLPFPKNTIEKLWFNFIIALDSFLARWPLPTGYELHYEVEKPI